MENTFLINALLVWGMSRDEVGDMSTKGGHVYTWNTHLQQGKEDYVYRKGICLKSGDMSAVFPERQRPYFYGSF